MKKALTYFEECCLAEFPEIAQTREITRKQALQVIADYDAPYPTKILNPLNAVRRGVFRFNANFDIPDQESLNVEIISSVPEPIKETIKQTETDEELDSRIRETYKSMETLVNSVADGKITSLMISGNPGIGKSYTVEEILKNHGNSSYTFVSGYVKTTGLYKLLWENRFQNSVIIFDDSDKILGEMDSINMLKKALELKKTRRISWLSERNFVDEDGMDIPKTFDYEGSIIFLTNLDFHAMIEAEKAVSIHLAALENRSIYLDLEVKTNREVLTRIKQVLKESTILTSKGIDVEKESILMEYLERNLTKLRGLSLRSVEKLATLYITSPDDWEELANRVMIKK